MTNYINNLKISRTTIGTPPNRTNPFATNRGMYSTQNSPRGPKDEIGLIGYERRGKKQGANDRKPNPFCIYCDGEHWIEKCSDAKAQSAPNLIKKIREHSACTVCLKRGHEAKECHSKEKVFCTYCKENNLQPVTGHKKLCCTKKPASGFESVAHADENDEPYAD